MRFSNSRINPRRRDVYSIAWAVTLLFYLIFVGCYIANLKKFIACDFKADYSCEMIHGAAVIVLPAALVTAFVPSDES